MMQYRRRSARQSRLTAAGSAVLLTIGLLAVGGNPAQAANIDIFDPNAILALVEEDLGNSPAIDLDQSELSVSGALSRRSADGDQDGLVVDAPASQDMASAAVDVGARLSDQIKITVPFATNVVGETTDTVVAATSYDSTALYVQPTYQGVRLMTVLGSHDAPSSFTYDLAVPEGTTARPDLDGGLDLLDAEGLSVGTIRPPWARDANGLNLPTTYEWSDGSLTQHIDLSDPGVAFPVIADPAWTYTVGWNIETKTVSQVRNLLYSCFNCYFPVAGAPAAFPTYGQFLPLEVGPIPGVLGWNFNCYMDLTYYENQGSGWAWFGYRFLAAASHVDGLGSSIDFSFNPAWQESNPDNRYTQLVVDAWIQNENPMGIGQPAYIAGAWYNWGAFAGNLRTA